MINFTPDERETIPGYKFVDVATPVQVPEATDRGRLAELIEAAGREQAKHHADDMSTEALMLKNARAEIVRATVALAWRAIAEAAPTEADATRAKANAWQAAHLRS